MVHARAPKRLPLLNVSIMRGRSHSFELRTETFPGPLKTAGAGDDLHRLKGITRSQNPKIETMKITIVGAAGGSFESVRKGRPAACSKGEKNLRP